MRAVLVRQPGGPDALEVVELPVPVPGAGQVQIRAEAFGVGQPDVLIRRGVYKWMPPLPANPGNDVAGRISAVGHGVVGISVGQIAKSIIFRRKSDESAVLVITSGDKRVDEKKVDALVGKTGRADADFVKARTGFTIGGVSPVGHVTKPVVLIDRELFRFEEIWAAAGHPHAVFQLRPHDLEKLTGAPVADVV